jgi:WD40 repeat protein
MTFAIGGMDGTIHIYDWSQGIPPIERGVVNYPRTFTKPRTITFSFIHGSHFLVIGGEDETATIYNLAENRRMGTLEHQSECGAGFYIWLIVTRRLLYSRCNGLWSADH